MRDVVKIRRYSNASCAPLIITRNRRKSKHDLFACTVPNSQRQKSVDFPVPCTASAFFRPPTTEIKILVAVIIYWQLLPPGIFSVLKLVGCAVLHVALEGLCWHMQQKCREHFTTADAVLMCVEAIAKIVYVVRRKLAFLNASMFYYSR